MMSHRVLALGEIPMYGSSTIVMKAVESKIDEVLSRAEVQAEIAASVEAGVLAELPDTIRKITKDKVNRYDAPLQETIQKVVEGWLKSHADEIRVQIEKAAEAAVNETTIFELVARQQFTHFLSQMAGAAVEKAAAKKERADKKKRAKAA